MQQWITCPECGQKLCKADSNAISKGIRIKCNKYRQEVEIRLKVNRMSTMIISGFPGIGKTTVYEQRKDINCLDSDSSGFSWIVEKRIGGNRFRNPEFPQNYIEHIKANMGKVDVIFVSTHETVRNALKENGLRYYLIYPDRSRKLEFLENYSKRGNDAIFIKMMLDSWDKLIDGCEAETYPKKMTLRENEYLADSQLFNS